MESRMYTIAKLYRDCLRLADYLGHRLLGNHAALNGSVGARFLFNLGAPQQGNRQQLRDQIRSSFRVNAGITDPAKIEEAKDAAVRGLGNFMFYEAARMAADEAIAKGLDPGAAARAVPFRFVAEDSPEAQKEPEPVWDEDDDDEEEEGGAEGSESDEDDEDSGSEDEEEETDSKGPEAGGKKAA